MKQLLTNLFTGSILLCGISYANKVAAQEIHTDDYLLNGQNNGLSNDSTEKTNVPEGIYAWTIEPRFGEIRPAQYDTIPHRFQNEAFTSGPTGHYNYTGNLGAPRISRLFYEQGGSMMAHPFIFSQPYDFFLKDTSQLLFTNTKSPFTNLTYHECGNKQNGEDRLRALFSTNAGKKLGVGFRADYLYGRGYYESQSTAHVDGTVFASYRDERYQMHAYIQHTQLKNTENGGIENDDYVNRPESFPTRYGTGDMPVNLARAWNKLGGNTVFLTHQYHLGFRRYRNAEGQIIHREQLPKGIGITPDTLSNTNAFPPATLSGTALAQTAEDSLSATPQTTKNQPRIPRGVDNEKNQTDTHTGEAPQITSEFVPVSSFIHTLRIDDQRRRFLSNETNNADSPGYFEHFYLPGDSANDYTHHLSIENTIAIELHEGFNKWMKTGMRLFAKHQLAQFTLPDIRQVKTKYTENYFSLGAQLLKEQGKLFHYNVLGEIRTTGTDWGEFNVEGNASLAIPFASDSLNISLNGYVRNERPSFYYRHYHGRNAWWDNDNLNKVFRFRAGGTISYKKTRLTATLENIQNYLFFTEELTPYEASDGFTAYRHGVSVAQAAKNTQLFAVTLNQDFRWGPLNWENEFTYQTSTNKDVLPIPAFTGYSNLYLLFRIAKVLRTELGADVRFFTRYAAPSYSPIIGQYTVQDERYKVEIGNYPIVNVYANFHLKRTRFYVMASHVNYSSGSGSPFLVPHYPINRLVLRLGLSWNFIN